MPDKADCLRLEQMRKLECSNKLSFRCKLGYQMVLLFLSLFKPVNKIGRSKGDEIILKGVINGQEISFCLFDTEKIFFALKKSRSSKCFAT